jgi:hypothetical protein
MDTAERKSHPITVKINMQNANVKSRVSPPQPRNSTARAYCNSTRRRSTRHMAAHDRILCRDGTTPYVCENDTSYS